MNGITDEYIRDLAINYQIAKIKYFIQKLKLIVTVIDKNSGIIIAIIIGHDLNMSYKPESITWNYEYPVECKYFTSDKEKYPESSPITFEQVKLVLDHLYDVGPDMKKAIEEKNGNIVIYGDWDVFKI